MKPKTRKHCLVFVLTIFIFFFVGVLRRLEHIYIQIAEVCDEVYAHVFNTVTTKNQPSVMSASHPNLGIERLALKIHKTTLSVWATKQFTQTLNYCGNSHSNWGFL